jgi:NhaP-type Na+/H+ or K+/H+ antiporter
VLAASIVRGRYAEQHVSRNVRDIISAESGANDGLGFPFIFLPILLMRRGQATVGAAVGEWFLTVWLYEIILSCVMGAVIGFVARKTLKEAHKRQLVDHESFLAYGIGLAFLTLGVVGVIGSDDVLACFVAGNSLTWKDFYRIESEDDTFQDVIDSLLNAVGFSVILCYCSLDSPLVISMTTECVHLHRSSDSLVGLFRRRATFDSLAYGRSSHPDPIAQTIALDYIAL